MHSYNVQLFYFINGLANQPFWDAFFLLLTTTLSSALFWLCIAYLAVHRHPAQKMHQTVSRYHEWFQIGASLILTFTLVQYLKIIVALPRPFLVIEHINSVLVYGANDSFPSGHAAMSMALAVSVYAFHRPLGLFIAGAAVLIGFSRVYVGVHYPLDVLVGFVIGIFIPLLVSAAFRLARPPTKIAPQEEGL